MARVFYVLLALLLAAGAAFLLFGQRTTQAQAPTPTVPATAKVAQDDNLQWMLGGIAQPFRQGAEVAVTDEVLASVNVKRGTDQPGQRDIDLLLYRGSAVSPIDDADVKAIAQMRYMDHGQFKTVALHSEGGHYLLPVKFAMPGEWQVEIVIDQAGKHTTLQLALDLFQ